MEKKPQIIAHRGFWKTNPETPENSIQALKNAQNLGVYGSEFDVQMTKDGVLIVYHDEFIEDVEISKTNFSDLQKFKLENGEEIPTLEDFIRQGKVFPNVKLIIELKPCRSEHLENKMVEKALDLVRKYKVEKQCEFISFSLNICEEIKKSAPEFTVQFLNGDSSPQELKAKGIDGLDYHYEVLIDEHSNWISEAKSLGLITNSWTVNNPEIFKRLQEMGIDFVTTDIPDVFL